MPRPGAISSLQLHCSNSSTGSWHLPPPTRNQDILSKDHDLRLAQCEDRVDMSIIVEVERAVGWSKLWDLGLPDHGPKCIDGLRNLVKVITFPLHALSACRLCEEEDITRDSLLSYVLTTHSRSPCNSDKLLPLLLSASDWLSSVTCVLWLI